MEKLQRFSFERKVEDTNINNKQYLENEYKLILESNKPYQNKCDYIGHSIIAIDDKINLLDNEIKQLQDYKKKLKSAKNIALEVGAIVFKQYGISKIEGAAISSITTTTGVKMQKAVVNITNEQALIEQGFYKKVVDEKKVQAAYANNEYKELILKYANIDYTTKITPSKLKINKRRTIDNNPFVIDIPDI